MNFPVAIKTPVNQLMKDGLIKAMDAVQALAENGFTVISVDLKTPSLPTVKVQECPQCKALLKKGEAVYYSFGRDGDHYGPWQEGQFKLGGCRIVWTEMRSV